MTTPTHPSDIRGIRGSMLTFKADPFFHPLSECYDFWTDGLLVISGSRILDIGPYTGTITRWPDLTHIDTWPGSIIMPGFIDCHTHYVQAPMVASCGDTLLHWLNRYTFPTEARFADKTFADNVAQAFLRQLLAEGTTTANVFATTFATSVDAFFEESERFNTRMICGKVLQDRNIPDNLRDPSPQQSVELSESLLHKWHRRGRQLYAVIPRFAPTSTDTQLSLAGDLYRRHLDKGVYMHTHLDEAEDEIKWVRDLFPWAASYTDVYRHYGLLGPRSIMAHCCIVTPQEWQTLHDCGCAVAHCPSSNLFLGDGRFRYWEATCHNRPVPFGIGSDIGGGTSFSIPRQLGEAYKVAMIHARSLSPARSFYLATLGGARTLSLDGTIGSLQPGNEADITVLNLTPTPFMEWRMQYTDDIFQRLFILQTLAPASMIRATYVAGRKVYDAQAQQPFTYPA